MGHWGWRPLINALFICVWVTGCSIASDTAPTLAPTSLPPVTLTLRNREPIRASIAAPPPQAPTPTPKEVAQARLHVVRPGDTLLGIALDYGVDVAAIQAANPELDPLALQVGEQIVVPPPGVPAPDTVSFALELPLPACREMITGKIQCLGQVINPQTETIEQVRVRVRLMDASGAVLAEGTTSVEQTLIPPGNAAPYSVIFDSISYAHVAVEPLLAQPASQSNWTTLETEVTTTEKKANRLEIEATIRNPHERPVGLGRVVLTLFDSQGQVAGFRAAALEIGFEPGETRTILIEAVPASEDDTPPTFQLHAEARWR